MESPMYEKARVIESHADEHERIVKGGAMDARESSETRAYLKGLRDAAKLVRGEPVRLPTGEA